MLTRAEIEKALRDGARPGSRNVIPQDEIARCVTLVRRAMYEAWEQPGSGDAGSRPALLDIRLDQAGRVVSYRIRQSSGSPYFDQTVLKAAANAAPIRGLTPAFLKRYETLTVEFKLE
jgi:TonB family protein